MRGLFQAAAAAILLALAFAGCGGSTTPGDDPNIEPPVPQGVVVSADAYTVRRGGEVQMFARVNPPGAPWQVTWSVEPTHRATISGTGVLTASPTTTDFGDIVVRATSVHAPDLSDFTVIEMEAGNIIITGVPTEYEGRVAFLFVVRGTQILQDGASIATVGNYVEGGRVELPIRTVPVGEYIFELAFFPPDAGPNWPGSARLATYHRMVQTLIGGNPRSDDEIPYSGFTRRVD